MISALITAPYAGYILSAYGLAAFITLGLVVRAYIARQDQMKALHALEHPQDGSGLQ